MEERAILLIVDDEPFNVDYLEQELEDLDCDTVSAQNGREALEQVATQAPDVILLDIMMPEMDGFEVLAHLKADEALRDIPVIVISTQSPTEQSMTSDVLLTTIGQGLSVSKLLRCSLQFSKLLLTPDSEPDLGPG